MRRFPVLLVAAVAALSPIPVASAHGSPPPEEAPEGCVPPDVVAQYHPDHMSLHVALPVTGCPARENREFSMTAWLSRTEGQFTQAEGQVVGCGPFTSSDPADHTLDRFSLCEFDMTMGHPSPEATWYAIDVTYPGADGDETVSFRSFCTTSDDGAFCTEDDAR